MFAQTEASLRTGRDGGGLKESSSELVLRDYPVFMQMMWDGRVTKGLIWSFTFCLASAASVPTSDSSVLAPVSIFHNGCFVPNKTKELLSKGSSFVLLSSHKHLRWGFIEFLSSSWRFKESLYKRSSQAEKYIGTWVLFFETPLNIFCETFGLKIQLTLFVYLAWNHRCQDWLPGSGLARCLSVILSSVNRLQNEIDSQAFNTTCRYFYTEHFQSAKCNSRFAIASLN